MSDPYPQNLILYFKEQRISSNVHDSLPSTVNYGYIYYIGLSKVLSKVMKI